MPLDGDSPARSTARARRATGLPRGPVLLGVRAVIARELRAHPPLEPDRHGHRAARSSSTARAAEGARPDRRAKTYSIPKASPRASAESGFRSRGVTVTVTATDSDGTTSACASGPRVRIDTPQEVEYYRHGGILCYVLRRLAAAKA